MKRKIFYFSVLLILEISCRNDRNQNTQLSSITVKNDSIVQWDGFSCGDEKRNIIYGLDSNFYFKITLNNSSAGEFNLPNDVYNIKAQLVYFSPKVGSHHYMNECSDVYLTDFENNYLPDTLNCSRGNFTIKFIKYLSIQETQYGLTIRDAYFCNKKKRLNKEIKFISTDKILHSNVRGG
jgi:hypothetical protein